jgi:hypothetical protein
MSDGFAGEGEIIRGRISRSYRGLAGLGVETVQMLQNYFNLANSESSLTGFG